MQQSAESVARSDLFCVGSVLVRTSVLNSLTHSESPTRCHIPLDFQPPRPLHIHATNCSTSTCLCLLLPVTRASQFKPANLADGTVRMC